MSKTIVTPLYQGDVAYVLRQRLGPVQAWEDLLADMRQGKRSFHGLLLLPFGVSASSRPLYLPRHVRQFIHDASDISPPPANAAKALTPTYLTEVDMTLDCEGWRYRKLLPIKTGTAPAAPNSAGPRPTGCSRGDTAYSNA